MNNNKYFWAMAAWLLPLTAWGQFAVGDLSVLRDHINK
jgi:hypothetical protein